MTRRSPATGGNGSLPVVPPGEKPGVARPDDIRRHNLARVLGEVHGEGALSRAELTRRLLLSRSTIRALVTDLCDLGLVEESVPVGGERAGRPSHVVAPRPDGPYALAVDVEVDRLVIAAVTLGGTLVRRYVRVLGAADRSAPAVARIMAEEVRTVAAELPASCWPIGLGVSVPGTVGKASGFIAAAPNLHWYGEPLGPMLQELLPHLPVALGNDADMGVLAEHLRGAARRATDVVYLTGKVGVGAGILVNGQPLRGAAGLAGEIGHTVLDPAGPACHCGVRGCVESLIGEAALLRLSGRTGQPDPEAVASVLADARAGDPAARAGVRQVGRDLGRVLANLVNLLNPEVIVLGGALADIFEAARADVLTVVDAQAMAAARATVDFRVSPLGADSSLLGAAELAFRNLLTDPLAAPSGRLHAARGVHPSSRVTESARHPDIA
ncbi:MAG: putative family sugar kinase [Frankiales bacterium]|nr:putative family sugar kinase [Frankiales bacterium]